MVQNIDSLYLTAPIVIIAFSFGLVIYCFKKGGFSKWTLLFSAVAYWVAILLKFAIQLPTVAIVESVSSNNPLVLGLYYGIQTGILEVGGAFIVAVYAYSHGKIKDGDAEGFGVGLAFWENGVFIALPLLLDYIAYLAILSSPSSPIAKTLYSTLASAAPSLFYGPTQALPLIGLSILERISSLLAHFSWGSLAVLSAVYRKRNYFALAFPIGFSIDFLVPFEASLGLGFFELIIFLISLVGTIVTLKVARQVRGQMKNSAREDLHGAGESPSKMNNP